MSKMSAHTSSTMFCRRYPQVTTSASRKVSSRGRPSPLSHGSSSRSATQHSSSPSCSSSSPDIRSYRNGFSVLERCCVATSFLSAGEAVACYPVRRGVRFSICQERTPPIAHAMGFCIILIALHGHDKRVWGVAWSPDGKRLATGSRDRTARIWDIESGSQLLVVLRGHNGKVRGVAWSPDGGRLATASADRTARIWDADHGRELATLHGHSDEVRAVAWSPDGTRLASASDDRTARIWDAGHGQEIVTLHGHCDYVRAVAWSPDGKQLASASADRTIRIWDTHSGAQIVVGAHIAPVEGVSWSPDGTRVASSSYDGTSRIWNATISIAELVANAHQRVSRELTAEERRDLMLPPASG